jgi:hypothetical protein
MSINEEVKSHGYVMLQIWEALSSKVPNANFNISTGDSRSAYILSANVPAILGKGKKTSAGVFVKISNKRASPWRYSFIKEHQDEILQMKEQHDEVFVAFVNGTDGVACLDFDGLKQILDEHHEEQEWVSVSRKLRENYRVAGNDGKYERPLPKNNFPNIVVDYFEKQFK